MAQRKISPENYFYLSLIVAVLLLVLLVVNCLTALKTGKELHVIAQFFPSNLREFSNLNTLSDFESVRKEKEER